MCHSVVNSLCFGKTVIKFYREVFKVMLEYHPEIVPSDNLEKKEKEL